MKHLKATVALLAIAAIASAQNIVNISVGPGWPKADMIKDYHPKTVWTAAAEWGKVFDKRILVGVKADVSWHVAKFVGEWNETTEKYEESSNIYKKNTAIMLPISGWIAVDPVPQYRFHPVIHGQVGYNSLFYRQRHYEGAIKVNGELPANDFKYYNGFIAKFGLDGMFDLGKSASVFAGMEYQLAPLYHKDGDKLQQISFNAPMIRIGLSFLY